MKKIVIVCLLNIFFFPFLHAQGYEVSTAANPQWFFIRVNGAGATAGRVVAENNGAVSGEAIQTAGLTAMAKQLWRIEQGTASNTYHIINKYSGKKLDIVYDANKAQRIAVATETPSTEWRIIGSSGNYFLRVTTQPAGGTSGAVNLMQTGSENDYSLRFITSTSGEANAQFRFLAFRSYPIASTPDEIAWLRIQNVKTSLSGKCLTETAANSSNAPFLMANQAEGDFSQQWKIVLKAEPFETGRVDFINRATGRTIATHPVYDAHYYLQATGEGNESEGWRLQALDNSNYAITSGPLEAEWFWNASTDNELPVNYSPSLEKEQGFRWSFSLVEAVGTGIRQPETQSGVHIYVRDKTIQVESDSPYIVTNLSGLRMKNNHPLPTGVYLVTVKGKTTKVPVR
jgi:hypothetical protein